MWSSAEYATLLRCKNCSLDYGVCSLELDYCEPFSSGYVDWLGDRLVELSDREFAEDSAVDLALVPRLTGVVSCLAIVEGLSADAVVVL
jgi:hypothetical protein